MQAARIHTHSRDMNTKVHGQKLEAGDIIEDGDVYECTDGIWRRCGGQMIGEILGGETLVTIVRPLPVMTFGVS